MLETQTAHDRQWGWRILAMNTFAFTICFMAWMHLVIRRMLQQQASHLTSQMEVAHQRPQPSEAGSPPIRRNCQQWPDETMKEPSPS